VQGRTRYIMSTSAPSIAGMPMSRSATVGRNVGEQRFVRQADVEAVAGGLDQRLARLDGAPHCFGEVYALLAELDLAAGDA
jgi:hypothetical protein